MYQNENALATRLTKIEESCNLIEKLGMSRECSEIKVSFHFYASDIFVSLFCFWFFFFCFALICILTTKKTEYVTLHFKETI